MEAVKDADGNWFFAGIFACLQRYSTYYVCVNGSNIGDVRLARHTMLMSYPAIRRAPGDTFA